jgi:energy-coupling factor transport system substrate-specific component
LFRSSRLAYTALFAALSAALGFAGTLIPNVELITLAVFLGGVVTGAWSGFAIGALAEVVFSLLNPLGPAFPLVFAVQIFGMGVAGAAGGLLAPRLARMSGRGRALVLAVAGFLITLHFDVVTNLALGIHLGPVLPTLIGGLAFSMIHLGANTLGFAVLGVGGLRVFESFGLLGGSEPHARV